MQFTWTTLEARRRQKNMRLRQWHRWFAWRPVRLEHSLSSFDSSRIPGVHKYAFLEIVYRKRGVCDEYEYISKQEYMKEKIKSNE
jgi:hypothetical protein